MKFTNAVIAAVALLAIVIQESATASPKPCLAFASAPLKIKCVGTSLDGSDVLCSASFMINDSCGGPSLDDAFLDFKLADPETGQTYASVWTKPVDELDDWSNPPRFRISSVPTKIFARVAKHVEDKEKPGHAKLHVFSEDSIIYRGKLGGLGGRWWLSVSGVEGGLKLYLSPKREPRHYTARASQKTGRTKGGAETVAKGHAIDNGEYVELELAWTGGPGGKMPAKWILKKGMRLTSYSMSKKHIQRMEGDCYVDKNYGCVMQRVKD